MNYQKILQFILVITISFICENCYICDPGFGGLRTHVIFVDEMTGEDLFFGDNSPFIPDSLIIVWSRDGRDGYLQIDTTSFDVSLYQKESYGIIHYPDSTSDTLRMNAYKSKCDFEVELYFNENLVENYSSTEEEPIVLVKNNY